MKITIRSIAKKLVYHVCSISPLLTTKIHFYDRFKKFLNLEQPETFNEKLQWLKFNTYNNNPLITLCADKFSVREYIKEIGHPEILNEIYGVWNSVEEIDWDLLPNKFVMKCNHGAGYNIICENKKYIDKNSYKRKLNNWMKQDFWKNYAELHYKNIKKKIICEKYIETENGQLPEDYKVFCFHGKPKFIMICTERDTGSPKFYFVDLEWRLLPYGSNYFSLNKPINKPIGHEKLIEYSKKLSSNFPFVRVDFYLNSGNIIFGELTFFPAAGLDNDLNNEENKNVDLEIGKMINLKE
ncbi:ATP-grasp fold amidoligase family protein [Xenorhabdus sp. XENO-10]|uniref:ATP-grasp fold amidoligase family protein n=1 Tax=Xenorhabdus yunnanensis TaxID=3025878 RepID=A0ABT5LBX1_9GAMM|nr:ATP-grasp fold amidoligase family protein [Xenorhabdus yunnanensis]MDC9588582.1 ATP-grasp fold amidoligase family protein [Xenorhabdus yunnanensis]